MNKIWQLIKDHPRDVIIGAIIVLLAVCGVPLLINWAFSEPAWLDCFAVDWEAKDALAYYGSALGFIGTVVLGAITVYQTRKAHEQTEKANTQTEKANQLAEEALAQTQRANELAAKMQKLEEARFLSMVSIENVRFRTIKLADVSVQKTPFMFPHTQKPLSLTSLMVLIPPNALLLIQSYRIRVISILEHFPLLQIILVALGALPQNGMVLHRKDRRVPAF